MSSWHRYPSIYNVGHAIVKDIFQSDVTIEEKVDGSQFSFGLINSELMVRSKGVVMDVNAPEKMFTKAVDTVKSIQHLLTPEWTYRCEYLSKPKHNTLAYDRTPNKYLILFDINTGEEHYLNPLMKQTEADRLGLETVPLLFQGQVTDVNVIYELLNTISVLGGQNIEGIVIKNYALFGPDKKILMAKHVSEAFKEVHRGDWKERNPTNGDVVQRLVDQLKTPARWNKAIQHLKERGDLTNSPKDIGPLIKEVQQDVQTEEKLYIMEYLYNAHINHILRGSTGGLPEYYKNKLLESSFEPIVLSDKDADLFISTLENPPEPNEALKKAFDKHIKGDNK